MDLDTKVTIPDHVLFNRVGDEAVLLDLESGTYFGLNEVGAMVWEVLLQGQTIRTGFEKLRDRYDVPPDQLLADLTEIVTSLFDLELIRIAGH